MRICAMLLCCLPALGQLQFEAASVKVSKGDTPGTSGYTMSGQLTAFNADMRGLVLTAYDVRPGALLGAPSWFDSDRFDIVAKAVPGTKFDDVRVMLRELLKERFGLEAHWDEKVMAAFALTVAKGGPKLQESSATQVGCTPGMSVKWGMFHITCKMVGSLGGVIMAMGGPYLDGLPVVDQTALKGTWDFTLDYTPRPQYDSATGPAVSFFEALEQQLGLRLEAKKLPVPVLVIDRINRELSEN
jgi:uncharacterized protein (TIGR03435 family)